MYSTEGSWVKLHRGLVDHWVFQDPMHLKVWCYLIVTANFKPSKAMVGGRLVTIERGEVLTSYGKVAEVCHCSIKRVRTIVTHLETDEMVVRKPTRGATHLSIVNYGRYQDVGQGKGTQGAGEGHETGNIIRSKESKKERIEEKSSRGVGALAPPSPLRADVHTLFQIRGQPTEEADRFFDHYDAQGWVRGNGQVIRNWQALIPGWIAKQQEINNGNTKRTRGERVGYDRADATGYLGEVATQFGLRDTRAVGSVDGEAHGKALPRTGS